MRILIKTIAAASLIAGAASAQDESPFTGEFVYMPELWTVASGGIEQSSRYLHNIDLTLEWDLSKSGLDGGTIFIYGMSNNKSELTGDIVGDLQTVSNIDNGELYRLEEAWYQQEFEGGRVKLGLIDLNSEFDAIELGGFFINSSHGIGPDFSQTGENGPSIFPSTSPAVVFEYSASEQLRFTGGIFDAVPNNPDNPMAHRISFNEGALFVAEMNYMASNDMRFALGGYRYSSEFDALLTGLPKKGNGGLYAIVEAPINEILSGWLRVGFANSTVNPLNHYIGGGLLLSKPFAGREDDQLGFAVATAWNGDDNKQLLISDGSIPASAEYNFELSYNYVVNDMISIQPDVQYIVNVGGTKDLDNALVMGVRFQFAVGF